MKYVKVQLRIKGILETNEKIQIIKFWNQSE